MSDIINETISIIMPSFNRAWSIERAIKSVLEQTDDNWELIIIDDGSDDGTKRIIEKYLIDQRIRYYFQANQGVGSARNAGYKESRGEYITFLDSDDELCSNAIEQMRKDIPLFTNEKVSLIIYLSKKNDDPQYKDDSVIDGRKLNLKDAISGNWPKIETLQFLKRELFNHEKFPEEQGGMENMLWFKLLKYQTRALLRNKVLRIYHTGHEDRLTGKNQILLRSKTMPRLYKDFLDEFKHDYEIYNRKVLAYFYLEMGIFQIINKEKKEGRESLSTSVSYNNSKRFVAAIIYTLSFFPNKIFIQFTKWAHVLKKILK